MDRRSDKLPDEVLFVRVQLKVPPCERTDEIEDLAGRCAAAEPIDDGGGECGLIGECLAELSEEVIFIGTDAEAIFQNGEVERELDIIDQCVDCAVARTPAAGESADLGQIRTYIEVIPEHALTGDPPFGAGQDEGAEVGNKRGPAGEHIELHAGCEIRTAMAGRRRSGFMEAPKVAQADYRFAALVPQNGCQGTVGGRPSWKWLRTAEYVVDELLVSLVSGSYECETMLGNSTITDLRHD